MSIDVEYAIKKDIRNNPVIREVDTRQTRELRRVVLLAALGVALLLFSVWQHFQIVKTRIDTEKLRSAITEEQTVGRQLRLNLEALRAPEAIERRARAQGLVPPAMKDTLVLERARVPAAPRGVVALAR